MPNPPPNRIGRATFAQFEQAFNLITKGSSIAGVRLCHNWYSNWSWIAKDNLDSPFFEAIDDCLNDDCIHQIIDHLDCLHLIYFAHINQRFKVIVGKKLSRLRIFPCTVGTIQLMNFRYILYMFGSSVTELSLSLKVFPSNFGYYTDATIRCILETIYHFTGPSLKKVIIHDLDFNPCIKLNEKRSFELEFRLFSERGIEMNFIPIN